MKFMPKPLKEKFKRCGCKSNCKVFCKLDQKEPKFGGDITDKVIITLFSSAGFRLEVWNYFTWKDIKMFKNQDGSYRGGALLVYGNDEESYWTHITPEACKFIEMYREKWKSDIGVYPKVDQPLLKAVKFPTIHRLSSIGVRKRVEKIVKRIGIRQSLPEGKKRYEVPLDHGFRKYFNTMMRRAKVNYLNKEDMMDHANGLERHYERYQEEDFERFPEHQKAIPFLTISNEERLQAEAEQKQEEINILAKGNSKITEMQKRLERLEYGLPARRAEYNKMLLEVQDSNSIPAKILAPLFMMWFETRATEQEKRKIWKNIADAKKEGREMDMKTDYVTEDAVGISMDNIVDSLEYEGEYDYEAEQAIRDYREKPKDDESENTIVRNHKEYLKLKSEQQRSSKGFFD